MTIPTLSTLPVAPARTDPPATFVTRADAFLAAIVTFQGEMNTSIGAMNTDIAQVNADAISAAASATAAANASNASAWISGTTYALADVVYSPIDYQSYRRTIAGAGTTDPSSDATNWTKISAEPLPSQTGNAGNYLTTDGTSASWGEVSASPTLEATASGALANGDTVIVNADGTVSVVAGTIDDTPTNGTAEVFESASTIYNSAIFDPDSNKIIIAYRDNGNTYATTVVGTVSGTSISFGTPFAFDGVGGGATWISATFDSNSSKVVIAYRDDGNTSYGTAIVGTVSGTSISFGTPVVFESANAYDISATFDSNSNKVVIAYIDAGNSSYGTAIVGTVSGTSISFGTATVFESATSDNPSATFDSNSNKVVIAYRDGGNGYFGTAIVGTVSGTSISFGTAVVYENAVSNNPSITFDSNSNKVVIAYTDAGNSNYGTAIVGTVSGTSISFGTATVFESAGSIYIAATFDSNVNRIVITYSDVGNSNYGTMIVGTVSGTSISFGTAEVFESATILSSKNAATFDSNSNKVITSYSDGGNSNYGTAVVITAATVTTNLTDENYIGISDGAYSDAATAKVQIVGSVDDAQSGLTAGQHYYVQTDGTLSTTADDPSVFAGTAVSATKLIVKG